MEGKGKIKERRRMSGREEKTREEKKRRGEERRGIEEKMMLSVVQNKDIDRKIRRFG